MPGQKLQFLCWHKNFWSGTKCNTICDLAKNILTNTKVFRTCRRTRHKYLPLGMRGCPAHIGFFWNKIAKLIKSMVSAVFYYFSLGWKYMQYIQWGEISFYSGTTNFWQIIFQPGGRLCPFSLLLPPTNFLIFRQACTWYWYVLYDKNAPLEKIISHCNALCAVSGAAYS